MMIFQMALNFMIPEIPELVIDGERDRKQHFEAYQQKRKKDKKGEDLISQE